MKELQVLEIRVFNRRLGKPLIRGSESPGASASARIFENGACFLCGRRYEGLSKRKNFTPRPTLKYADFAASSLKRASVVRIGRLAIVEADLLLGEIGEISTERLNRIRRPLADWIMGVLEFKSEGARREG